MIRSVVRFLYSRWRWLSIFFFLLLLSVKTVNWIQTYTRLALQSEFLTLFVSGIGLYYLTWPGLTPKVDRIACRY